MIKFVKGRTKLLWEPKVASTAFAINNLISFNGSGYLTPSTSSSTTLLGVGSKTVAATDSDYASATRIPVEVPMDRNCLIEADVTGTLTTAMVGTTMDLSDATTVNAGADSIHAVRCVKFISATKGLFTLNIPIAS